MKLFLGRTYPDVLAAARKRITARGGRKAFLVVPDRFSLEAEEALLRGGAEKTLFDVEVTTIARLANRLDVGGAVLTAEGCAIVVASILTEHADELVCFRDTRCAAALYGTIAQLAASGVGPADLPEAGEIANAALARKLSDLKLIYGALEAFLRQKGYRDPSAKLTDAIAAVRDAVWVKNADFVFAGFDALPKLSERFVAELDAYAHATAFCLVDGKHPYGEWTLASQLRDALRALGRPPEEERIGLPLSLLHEAILADLCTGRKRDYAELCGEDESILAVRAENDDAGAEYCAKELLRYVREKGLRYREIAIVTADPDSLTDTLKEYGVPCNSDAAVNLALHPLARLMTDALACVAAHCDTEAFARLCFNPLLGVSAEDYALWDDYVRRFGLDHSDHLKVYDRVPQGKSAKRDGETVELARVRAEEVRKKAAAIVERLGAACTSVPTCARALADLEMPALGDVVADLDEGYRKFDGMATKRIAAVLDNLRIAASGMRAEKNVAEQTRRLLAAGLEAADVHVAPVFLDAVSVFAPESFGFGSYKLIFWLGANDGVLPGTCRDCGLLGDGELDLLNALDRFRSVRLRIEPHIADVNARARLQLVSTLFLAPRIEMIATGGDRAPDFVWRALREDYGVPVYDATSLSDPDAPASPALARIALFHAPLCGLARGQAHRVAVMGEKGAGARVAAVLREAARIRTDGQPRTELPFDEWRRLFFRGGKTSVSQLEIYFSCPYRHFLQYGLGCRPRKVARADAADIGVVLHAVAEAFMPRMPSREEDIAAVAAECAEQALSDNEAFASAGEKNKLLLEQLRRESEALCRDLFAFASTTAFRFAGAEVGFGDDATRTDGAPCFPGLSVGGVRLTGRIDRIDLADASPSPYALLMDYKTGRVKYTLQDVYYGTQIQLLAYMRVVAQNGYAPAAVLYFPINNDFSNGDGKRAVGRCGGWTGEEAGGSLDRNGDSVYLPCKDGSDYVFTADEWERWLSYVDSLLTKAVSEIGSGFIEAKPYRTDRFASCDYCDGRSACPYRIASPVRERVEIGKDSIVPHGAPSAAAEPTEMSATGVEKCNR